MRDLTERIAALSPAKRALLELRLKQKGSDAAQSIPRNTNRDSVPLSFGQQRLWFLDQLEPNSPLYNISKAVRLSGCLNVEALQKTVDAIVARHEVLRTTFVSVDGNPVQVIRPSRPVDLAKTDLSWSPESNRELKVQHLLEEEAQRPFDLASDLMLRASLLRLSENEHVLQLVMHHIASDGWSMAVLFRELATLYQAFSNGKPPSVPELPIQYADFAVWQREWLQGELLERQLSYWKKQLNAISTLQLPTDRGRAAVQSHRGARQSLLVPKDLSEKLNALSRTQGVTLFMTLLAAFQTLLYRYTGQEDIAVGSTIAGRTRHEIEDLIGFFVNTLVLRSNLSGNPSFKELLVRMREVALGAYAHQNVPFEKLVEELQPERNLSHSPLFQVMFVLQNAPSTALQLHGLSVNPVKLESETAKFDLTLSMREEAEGLRGGLSYNTDLFDNATISRMLAHFRVLLEGIVANPDQRLADLPMLTQAEKHRLLVEWNDTEKDYPKDKGIHQLFEQQVERTPEAVAVVFEERQLTYRELNRRANQLARYLMKLGVEPDVLVGICMERSLEMVVGLLGVLKAGGAYVPLDPEYPRKRLAFMVEDCRAPVLLTQTRLVENLPGCGAQVVCLDPDCQAIVSESGENPASAVGAENIAYVIYTSGSTGQPKGVMISHRAICNHMRWMQDRFPLSSGEDRVVQKTPFSFDASVWEFFAPLISGVPLVMARPGGHCDTGYLARLIAQEKVTVFQLVPSLLQMILEEEEVDKCQRLRRVFCGGEALSVKLQDRVSNRLGVDLHNLYGPTEATIDATFWTCRRDANLRNVPIGRPVSNTQSYLLDANWNPVPVGITGEIYLGGQGLARGYWNRPGLTAEKFLPNPFSAEPGSRLYRTGDLARYRADGAIEFLGRSDHQVKMRGFRIELGEIEAALAQHPAIREAVVIARENHNNRGSGLGNAEGESYNSKSEIRNPKSADKRLVAYVVPKQATSPTAHELRSFLKEKLPDYMLPASFVFSDTLPLLYNGKVNRKALPAPDGIRPELTETFIAPRTPTEEALAGIWGQLLGVNQVGIRDDFFDLGGHSLLAVRLFAQIENAFHKRPPLSSLFERATIEHLARLINRQNQSTPPPPLVAIQPHGSKSPFFCVHEFFGDVFCYMNLARHLGQDRPFYALQPRGLNGTEEPFTDIGVMAAYYIDAIRTVQPEGPYALGGLCFGGIVAFEMAQQLRARGESVDILALLDSPARNRRDGKLTYGWSSLRDLLRGLPSWLIGCLELNRSQWIDLVKLKVRIAKAKRGVSSGSDVSSQDHAVKRIQQIGDLFHYSEQHRKIARAQHRALREYRPQVYPGRITLFRARMQPLGSFHKPDNGWGQLAAGGLDIRVVPGNHLGMLQEPHVRVLAEQLRACLEKSHTETDAKVKAEAKVVVEASLEPKPEPQPKLTNPAQ